MNIQNIRKLTGGVIRKNEPMALHTTFRVGGPADYYIIPRNAKETAALIRYLERNEIPYFILGVLSFGIGLLWVYPLVQESYAQFYLDLMRPKKVSDEWERTV